MREKNILDATFEESRKLVDETYIEEALKVSSNKQDRNRFWGEVVAILVEIFFTLLLGDSSCTNFTFDKNLLWT